MDLCVIIVNWNTRDTLADCLCSLRSVEGLEFETIVVDNASTDGSAEMVRQRFPEVALIENVENVGFARGSNQGILQSRGRYLLLLNSDTEVYPDALAAMTAFMERHAQAGACGPVLLNGDGTLQVSCHPTLTPAREFWRLTFLDQLWRRATYDQASWDRKTPRQVEVIKGACLLLRRKALDQVGPLDDDYFMYTEEMDLCYRLASAGWELWWVPQAVVTHYGEASSRQATETMYVQLYRSKVQFHRKFGGARRAAWFRALLGLAYGPRWIAATAAGVFAPRLAIRARTYRHLLAELPRM